MFEVLAQAGGGGGGVPWQSIIKLLFGVLIFAAPAIRVMAKAAKERSKKRQAEEAARRRHEQFLRTGRLEQAPQQAAQPASVLQAPPTQPPQSAPATLSSDDEAKRRLAEIYQRRRAELERLARASKPATTPAQTTLQTSAPASSRSVPVFVSPAAPHTKRGSSSPSRKAKQPKPTSSLSQSPALSDYHSASSAASEDSSVVHRLVKDVPAEHAAESGALLRSLAIKPGSPDLRRAFLLSEILGRPLSQREQ